MTVSAIVLAGGRSSRFGRDKLAEPLDGRPLLAHAVGVVQAIADDVVVVLAPDAPEPSLAGVRFARDPEPFGGPLVGLLAGLEVVTEETVLVVAGDMPSLDPGVLRLVIECLDGVQASALLDGETIRPLPAAFLRSAARAAGLRLRDTGERSLRALFGEIVVRTIPDTAWRALDPTAVTLRDIDRPSDLPA